MPQVANVIYDGLFLLSPAAASDVSGAMDFLRGVIERHGGTVETIRRWDDRRLAYPIQNQRRGTFILVFFTCEGGAVARIERDMKLSDEIARTLIIRGDHIGEAELEAEREEVGQSAAREAERAAAAADEDGNDGQRDSSDDADDSDDSEDDKK